MRAHCLYFFTIEGALSEGRITVHRRWTPYSHFFIIKVSAKGGHEKWASKVDNITKHLEKAPSLSFNIKACVIGELMVLTVLTVEGSYHIIFKYIFIVVVSDSTLQWKNAEILKQIFPEKEYRDLSPNFHIHVSVSELYIPRIELPFLLEEICGPILGIYKSLTDTWMWKLGLRPRNSQKRNI